MPAVGAGCCWARGDSWSREVPQNSGQVFQHGSLDRLTPLDCLTVKLLSMRLGHRRIIPLFRWSTALRQGSVAPCRTFGCDVFAGHRIPHVIDTRGMAVLPGCGGGR